MDPVSGTDGHAVPIPHDGEDLQVGPMELDARGDGKSPAMKAMESIGLHVVGETAGAADARNEDRVLRLELVFRQEALDSSEDRVVAATRTPPGNGGLIVAHLEFAIIGLTEMEKGTSAAHEAPPSGIFSRMAFSMAPGRRGSPRTRVQQSISTRVLALRSQASWPYRRFSGVM